jgi:Holliday junction resolvase RusA-like endonuclease
MPDEIDAFVEELDRDPYEVPPITGELHLSIDVQPASLQSRIESRMTFQEKIRDETQKYRYLFSGDIGVDITLQVHQADRYESDASPDLDNFLKPLLDSLAGPDGILIDDSQIRTLSINWMSWNREDTRLELFFRFIETEYVLKQGLAFVRIEGPLCMPIDTSLPVRAQRILFFAMRYQFRTRRHLMRLLDDYYASSSVLPVQRRFHRTRINGFEVKSVEEYRRELRQKLRGNI